MSDTLVLCYHAVSPSWPAALSITPEQLREQCAHLRDRGYESVGFSRALSASATGGKRVAITFDDAFGSVLELAKPILDEHGLTATVFVPTDFPGSGRPLAWHGTEQWLGGEHEHELACMSWDELRGLADAGWEIGSHTRSHPFLTRSSDAELEDELVRSRGACEERLGQECESLAYPFGDADARVVEAARAAGYRYACTLPELRDRMHAAGPLEWPRVGIYYDEPGWRWRLKMSRAARGLRATRVWGLADRGG